MEYEQAVVDVEAAPAGTMRVATAETWARILVAVDSPHDLGRLLGDPATTDGEVDVCCRTQRARNLLRRNHLTRLDKLLGITIADLRSIRQCGRESAVDILAALLLTLVGESGMQSKSSDVPLPGIDAQLDPPKSEGPHDDSTDEETVKDPLLDLLKGV
ncbi:hypothetical protein [Streptomyces sp. SLBN-134]|uniref:hypothetical protein n=1 Tax=Streptomyces sp. SLBN-134 TaxID=2768456 RepID=UPI00115140F6|nr:hypothetical protein [Streptomyces sp. SLBN-134]